jgi:hypothetical protein
MMDSPGKAKVALTFALYQGDQLIRRDVIAQDIVKVGKDPRSHLRVDDELASRMHAVIEVASPADITLIDLGNEPGTLVNGQRVNKCKIRPGDQIQIGSTLIHLEQADYAAAAPVVATAAPAAPVQHAAAAAAGYAVAAAPNPFAAAPAANPFSAGAPTATANPFAASNPFAGGGPAASPYAPSPYAPAPPYAGVADVDPNAPPGSYTYAMVRSGPDVNPDEVEVPHLASI